MATGGHAPVQGGTSQGRELETNYPKPSVAWACVAVLVVAYALSFVDRLILTLLVDPIRQDLQLSDVQISLLQGFSFALFYSLAGIPLGRLVDSGRRTTIIAVGIALWSLMTAACGLSRQYWQLFVARAGVGVGEATLGPAAYSLLSDLFPPGRRGLALGIFSTGTSLGAGFALLVGGWLVGAVAASGAVDVPWIGRLQPWQLTLIYVGLPGLLVALLVRALPEPVRQPDPTLPATTSAVSLGQLAAHYRQHASTIGMIHLATGCAGMGSYGIMSWAPAMLMRVHGWSPQEVGLLVGGSILVAGTIGVVTGGWLGDHLVQRGRPTGRLIAATVSMAIGAAGAVAYPLQSDATWIAACLMVAMLGGFMAVGCSAAALLAVVPNRMRGQVSAMFFLTNSLLGIGAGPVVVALFTDMVFGTPAAVRWSLLVVPPAAYLLAAAGFWIGRRPYRASLSAAGA